MKHIAYFFLYLIVALTIALNQPLNDTYPSLCNPPDEHSRYKVPLYICNHGTPPKDLKRNYSAATVNGPTAFIRFSLTWYRVIPCVL